MNKRFEALKQPRGWLWLTLLLLIAGLLWMLVYLAQRYETQQEQQRLESDLEQAASQVRAGYARSVQSMNALGTRAAPWLRAGNPKFEWRDSFAAHREWVRLEWRDATNQSVESVQSDYWQSATAGLADARYAADITSLCTAAWRESSAVASASYFAAVRTGGGVEVLDVCLAFAARAQANEVPQPIGYLVVTLALRPMLSDWIAGELQRDATVAFTEADGTRLALHGVTRSASRRFVATQLIDWGGQPVVLRMERGRPAADLFPNVLTALVTAMTLALVAVVALLAHDMRRRHRAEAELAQALALRKAMEDSLITGLRARDLSGRVTYVNPAFCAMVGFGPAEILRGALDAKGQPLQPYVAPYWPAHAVTEYRERQAQRFSEGAIAHEGYESVFVRKDGGELAVRVFEAPLIDARGVQTGWMSTVLDVSAQRVAENNLRATQDRLQEAARLATMGEMASLVSHELNQPLAAIASYATGAINLIAKNVQSTPTYGPEGSKNSEHTGSESTQSMMQEALQRIAAQAERAGRVIRSVNDFVRQRPRARESVDLHALIDGLLPLVNLQARAAGVALHHDCPPQSLALCDRTMIEQVVLNLARNAVQAMDKPEITRRELAIDVRAEPAGWRVQVADSGPGVAPDVATHMFAPFFTTKADGLGLGLSLCRTVVEQNGGTLEVAANAGGGTVFSFTLPGATAPHNTTP